VDAVNKCPDLAFGFPRCHEKQKQLALAFKAKSAAAIDCCVGATDGMLLWIERPTNVDCDRAECGPKKFFCGRKHKFGLNMQATCDADGMFLDVSIAHPASTSDFLAFSTSSLQKKIETPGFLAPGLCIFGRPCICQQWVFHDSLQGCQERDKGHLQFLPLTVVNQHRVCLWHVRWPVGYTAEGPPKGYGFAEDFSAHHVPVPFAQLLSSCQP
jgi:DDE superfamily endonuclease